MKLLKTWVFSLLIPLALTFVMTLFTQLSYIQFINILFIVSIIIFCMTFLILLVQEGIFDATSYGYRRLRYRLSSKKYQEAHADDTFFNPKQAKRKTYHIQQWVKIQLYVNAFYFLATLILAYFIK